MLALGLTKYTSSNQKTISVGLIADRHKFPTEDFVIQKIPKIDLDLIVNDFLPQAIERWMKQNVDGNTTVYLYITGFTPALTNFLKMWKGDRLYLMHYDKKHKGYVAEKWA